MKYFQLEVPNILKKKIHLIVSAFFLLCGLGLLILYLCSSSHGTLDMILNAGTELVGIGLTVFFVQLLFDRMQRHSDMKSLTWDLLFDLDYVVWVWQGGKRVFDIEELNFLLGSISPADPFPPITQNLILALGNKASNIKRTKIEIVKINPRLCQTLDELSKLSQIRDNDQLVPISEIAKIMKNVALAFAEILNIDCITKPGKTYPRNSFESAQYWRHTGENIGPIDTSREKLKELCQIQDRMN